MQTRLPGGMRILVRPEPQTPLVAADLFVRIDPATETAPGLTALAVRSLLLSTSTLSTAGMARDIAKLGGNVTAAAAPDWVQVSILTTPNKLDDALFLLTDVAQNADFDAAGVEEARQDLMGDVDSSAANTFPVALSGLRRTLWAGTPYAAPPFGTLSSVTRITRADLLRWYGQNFVPSRFLFVVTGAADKAAADKIAGGLGRSRFPEPRRALTFPPVLPPPTTDFAARHTALPGLNEVCVMVGFRGPAPASADYAPLLVANAVLGGMKTSRLFSRLRDRDGLGYQVGSQVTARGGGSEVTAFVFAAPTRPDPTTKRSVSVLGPVKDGILREIEGLKTVPLTPEELLRAKHFLAGTDKIRRERLEDRATLLGTAAEWLPGAADPEADMTEALRGVTAADVQRVAQTYFVHPAVSVVEPDGQSSPDGE